MLHRLSVSNYALIRDLDIEFAKPFSVITGETGAGKSIILGALSLILGSRADNLTFSDNNRKCTIEGTFDITKCDLESYFEDNNLDYDTTCIIRREITPQGKSRAFINDTPVNLNQLKELTGRLIDVHSQHQTLLLRENSFQLSVIDAVAGNSALLRTYRNAFRSHQQLVADLAITKDNNLKAKTELDYLLFIVDEFRKANLVHGEQEKMEEELDIQTHAEEIKTKLYQASGLLSEDEENILRQIKEVTALVNNASFHYPELKALAERLNSCLVEMKDIAEVIRDTAEKVIFSPEKIEQLNDRLSVIYKLEQKHHVSTIAELIALSDEFELKIQGIESLDQKIDDLNRQLKESELTLNKLANELSARRKAVVPGVEKSIINTVTQLGIKDAAFVIDLRQLKELSKEGSDEIRFLFSANKGGVPDDIARIASGGELSRLMLAVKSLISSNNLLPTIVFDEIDTGISGDIAGKVGSILKKISEDMQVITITHLPQIAAFGDEHFKVFKLSDTGSTWSVIKKLSVDEQIDELALMISGNHKSQGAREAAMELLNINR